jgi:4-amino-4-deoxychorismate lyase
MSRFIESIQLFHGVLLNLEFHQLRFERTRREVLGIKNHPRLAEQITVPRGLDSGRLKCRVSYEKVIELIEFEPQLERKVNTLKLVYSDSIEYGYKYADRGELELLFRRRGECDDILVVKKSCISDSFYANAVFWDGSEWITPDTPLLPGTMRAFLLNGGWIREERITPDDLNRFQKLKLINAMNDLEQAPEIPIDSIHL